MSYKRTRKRLAVKGAVSVPLSQKDAYFRKIKAYASNFVVIANDHMIFGHKNIDCPRYARCLDDAVKLDQQWVCNGCNHEFDIACHEATLVNTIGGVDYYGEETRVLKRIFGTIEHSKI